MNRRTFLALSGGTGAGIFLQSQEKYIHKLIPYVNAPKYPKPGEWAYYLSTCRECPAGCGLMMWHRDGRVTKAEGNPENPINKGKLCIRGQSSVMGEYDPERLKEPLIKTPGNQFLPTAWESALDGIRDEISKAGNVKLISNLQTGSLAGVMEKFAAQFGEQPLYYEAFNYESLRRANEEMYGRPVIPKYNLAESDLIVSVGADFLETWISPVEYTREFGEFHSLKNNTIGKFIYIGAYKSLTAMNADEFILTAPDEEVQFLSALKNRLGNTPGDENLPVDLLPKFNKLADEISRAQKPVILAGKPGDKSGAGKNAVILANQINDLPGNRNLIDFSANHALSKTADSEDVTEFFESIDGNTVLLIHDTNPVFTLPALKKQVEKAGKVVFIGSKPNETAELADWILPSHYYLEDWGDYEPWQGKASLQQPVMKPLFDTRSAGDIFLLLGNNHPGNEFREIVRDNWKNWAATTSTSEKNPEEKIAEINVADDKFYELLLQKAFLKKPVNEFTPAVSANAVYTGTFGTLQENQFHLHIQPSHFLYDGRLANRGWLQEIPHPVSNVVWQSWTDMNSEKATELGIEDGDIIKVKAAGSTLEVAVRLTDDIEKNTLAIDSGQGHTNFGKVANNVGVNAFSLLPVTGKNSIATVTIEKTRKKEPLLYLNATKNQHDRELLKHHSIEEIQNNTAETEEMNWPLPRGYTKEGDLYKGIEYKNHRWGMVVDLQKCVGCKACEAACYAENNIPVVGRENSEEGREMSWLKVVPYNISEEKTAFLPLPCQHCDSAPCEPVCPVYASVHTEEGLNAQIYNRCIGTRYCSNNCPYKVRRFNWVNFDHEFPENLQLNPEVTVRERGVMEKCTFCVQRIRNKEYQAKKENREVRDGEIVPACVQTCPTSALTFGDLMDENSEVRKLIEDKRKYQLLNELNTKTAVVYLKKITT